MIVVSVLLAFSKTIGSKTPAGKALYARAKSLEKWAWNIFCCRAECHLAQTTAGGRSHLIAVFGILFLVVGSVRQSTHEGESCSGKMSLIELLFWDWAWHHIIYVSEFVIEIFVSLCHFSCSLSDLKHVASSFSSFFTMPKAMKAMKVMQALSLLLVWLVIN